MAALYKNTIIYTIGNILPKAIVFIMLPIYMNYLSPEEYGLIQTINALVSVISILYLTSLRTSITRSFIDYETESDKQGFVLSVFLFLVTFATVITIILLNLDSIITPFLFNNIPKDPYYKYLIILSFLSIFPVIPLTLMRIREQAVKFVTFNIIETILIIILTVYLLIIKDMGAQGSLLALIYARIIMGTIFTLYIAIFTKLKIKNCKAVYIYSSLALAIPLIPHHLAGWANSAVDRVLIEQSLSLYELGIYSLGAQFNSGMMLLATSFNLAYAPRFYKMMKKNEVNQNFFTRIFSSVVLILTMLILLGLILIPLFVKYFGQNSYESNYLFVGFLFGGTLWHLGYIMSVSSVIYYKKMSRVALVTVATAIVNILLNIILIPVLGITGASFATYLAYFLEFYFVKQLSNKYTEGIFQIRPKVLYTSQLLLLISIFIAWLLKSYFILVIPFIVLSFFILKSRRYLLPT